MSDNWRFKTRSDVRFRVIAGEGVIIRQEAGEAVVVNEVGARILELLCQGASVNELIERLSQEYQAEPSQLEEDVPRYLAELETAGVVESAPP